MFDIFPSSKELREGMGFLNQLTCVGGKKSFDSMVYCWVTMGDVKDKL